MQALVRSMVSFLTRGPVAEVQSRGYMTDWRMLKDHKRRQLLGKHWFERNQLNVIRRNNILPLALRDAAREDLLKLPADSNTIRIRPRCSITSYPRSMSIRYRLARHAWRHLADNNKLSGIQKARW